jgi:hypothetical protein
VRRRAAAFAVIAAVAAGPAAPLAAQDPSQQTGLTPGVPLPSGVAHLADPTVLHGLTLGLQAGLGSGSRSTTFGYDNAAVTARWTPGTNAVGRRISLLFGVAEWHTPAYDNVFPDSLLDDLSNRDSLGAESTTAPLAGMSVVLFGDRAPSPTQPQWRTVFPQLQQFSLRMVQADGNPELQRAIARERDAFLWQNFTRPVLRQPTVVAGVLTRLDGLEVESDVQALDAFVSGAAGRGIFDAVVATHYLRYFDETELPAHALTGSAGVFVDLSDTPPASVLGVTVGYGRYHYRELFQVQPAAPRVSLDPVQNRLDVVVSIAGAPSTSNESTAGIALRFTHLSGGPVSARNLLSLVVSSNFKFLQ